MPYNELVGKYKIRGYKRILEYLQVNGFWEKSTEDILSWFEYVYEKEEITCMDVYIHVDSA